MSSVSIVGAGELGGTIARVLAGRSSFRHIILIDDAASVAAGKALDIQQAGAIDGYDVQLTGASDLGAAAGATVVIVADLAGPPNTEWSGDIGLALVRRLNALGVDAPLLFAGSSARDIIERSALELDVDRARLIGSAPEALASAVRAMVALEANVSATDVRLSVVGVPPRHAAVPWSDASIGGYSVTRVLDASAIARVDRRLQALWPPGAYALASAAARAAEAIVGQSRRLLSGFAILDHGPRGAAAAVGLALGRQGIDRIIAPELDTRERIVFDNSVAR
jgi:malate dehydrogenase